MLQAINGARMEILIASFIFDRDATGVSFIEALSAAQQRGVRVCLLVDDVGRLYSLPSVVSLLRKHKLEYCLFMPLRISPQVFRSIYGTTEKFCL